MEFPSTVLEESAIHAWRGNELASGKLSRGRWTQLLPGSREFTRKGRERLIVIEKFAAATGIIRKIAAGETNLRRPSTRVILNSTPSFSCFSSFLLLLLCSASASSANYRTRGCVRLNGKVNSLLEQWLTVTTRFNNSRSGSLSSISKGKDTYLSLIFL